MTLAVALTAVLLALSAPESDAPDITLIDKPERSKLEAEAERLDARVEVRRSTQSTLELTRGDTVFIEDTIKLKRSPRGRLSASATQVPGSNGLELAPTVTIEPMTGTKSSVRAVYAVRATPRATSGAKVSGVIQVREEGLEHAIATLAIEHTVTIGVTNLTLEDVELDRRAYLHHQSLALEAYGRLRGPTDALDLDKVVPGPPPARIIPGDAETLERYLRRRLLADVARTRLRAAADSSEPKIAEAAVLAIGSLSQRSPASATSSKLIEGKKAAWALLIAREWLNDVRIEEADGILSALRGRDEMTSSELARCLLLQSAIAAARAQPEEAAANAGRALCIDPAIKSDLARPIYASGLEAAVSAPNRCTRPLIIDSLRALRRKAPGGLELVVRATYGPDPFELVSGGDIEFWGSGGAIHRTEKVRAKNGMLEAIVPDTGELQSYSGQLLIAVYARDLSGVPVARFGAPSPAPVDIAEFSDQPTFDWPWWVWVVAGGVAAVGAATAVGLAVANRDTKYGIGPIRAEF